MRHACKQGRRSPPNSNETFLNDGAAAAATKRPVAVPPVKETARDDAMTINYNMNTHQTRTCFHACMSNKRSSHSGTEPMHNVQDTGG
jgi:hypothetical protein